MALAMAAFIILWISYASTSVTTGLLRGGYGLVFILFALVLPGAILHRWGKEPFMPSPSSAEIQRAKAPYNRAQEMGHVMRLDKHPDV
jgi:hypothetical protein